MGNVVIVEAEVVEFKAVVVVMVEVEVIAPPLVASELTELIPESLSPE